MDYTKVKLALLQRFRYTKEGYREKFRDAKPGDGETRRQFAARLAGYFDRWLEVAEVEKSFVALRETMLIEQFIKTCSSKLTVFLKERDCTTLDDLAGKADVFLEAQVQPSYEKAKGDEREFNASMRTSGNALKEDVRRTLRCFLCNKIGHKAENCQSRSKYSRPSTCWHCGKPGHKAERCNLRSGDKTQVSCLWTASDERQGEPDDSYITLKNGGRIPVVNAAVGRAPKFLVDNMPVVEAFFVGKVIAKCIDNPLYDLVLGNIPQAKEAHEPDLAWNCDQQSSNEIPPRTEHLGCEDMEERRIEMNRADSSRRVPSNHSTMLHVNVAGLGQAKNGSNRGQAPLNVPQVPILETTAEELSKEQRNDSSLKKCFDNVGKVIRKHKCRTRYDMVIRNNLLFRSCVFATGRSIEQLVLPTRYRPTVLSMAHDGIMSGHQGVKNTLALATEEFFWPGIQSDIKWYVRSCDVCQRTVPKGRVGKATLGTLPTIDTPFKRVAVDIIGPVRPTASSGNRYILTMVDMATRYPDAVPLRNIGTEQVAEALLEMFSRYGIPSEVLSDRGSCFTSDLMKEVSKLLSVKRLLTTPYHPMANGLVERFNGTIKQMMKRMCQERPKDWDRYLPALLFAYREVPQASLKFSPFELLYGRKVRGPLTILKEIWSNESLKADLKTTYAHVLELRNKLEGSCELAHHCLEEAKGKYKKYYDKKTVTRQLRPGDLVLILLPSDHNKLIMQWKGPFEVSSRRNEVDYELDVGGRKYST
ncbi:uncharacterized protein LOC120838968 [Ixodes scapularis]|uniref:uncharacterized protein LOC120838968 n=1 Tax=Ixodes scapularis TaxID=6945 RepID=UPI001A9CD068|nr:uncharacterized protein LOC120838968 [Ixodes scapularis]